MTVWHTWIVKEHTTPAPGVCLCCLFCIWKGKKAWKEGSTRNMISRRAITPLAPVRVVVIFCSRFLSFLYIKGANTAKRLGGRGVSFLTKCMCRYMRITRFTLNTHHRRRRSDLKWFRLPKFPTSFHRSPHTYQIRFHGSPQNSKPVFTWVNGVPVTQRIYQENW